MRVIQRILMPGLLSFPLDMDFFELNSLNVFKTVTDDMTDIDASEDSEILNRSRAVVGYGEDRDMIAAVEVEPRSGYRIWLRYSDGVSGEVDLSDMVGRGVFKVWLDRTFFERVHVSPHGSVVWSDDIELCPDALYMEVTGKSAEELFPALRGRPADA